MIDTLSHKVVAGTVSVIDPASRRVVRSIPVGAGPGGVALGTAKE